MEIEPTTPPRRIAQRTASGKQEDTHHCADIRLEPDELITFTSASGSEYDVVRKPWGYYATPSLNVRLPAKGLRPCLTRGRDGKRYILLVEKGCEVHFLEYAKQDQHTVLAWLDDEEALATLERSLKAGGGS